MKVDTLAAADPRHFLGDVLGGLCVDNWLPEHAAGPSSDPAPLPIDILLALSRWLPLCRAERARRMSAGGFFLGNYILGSLAAFVAPIVSRFPRSSVSYVLFSRWRACQCSFRQIATLAFLNFIEQNNAENIERRSRRYSR